MGEVVLVDNIVHHACALRDAPKVCAARTRDEDTSHEGSPREGGSLIMGGNTMHGVRRWGEGNRGKARSNTRIPR